MTGGKLLKQLRKEKRLTQREIGELLGVKKAAVQKYEIEAVKISVCSAKRLAEFFNIDWTDFFEEQEKPISIHWPALSEDSELPCEVGSLGSRLNRLRIIKGLSQETIAKVLNDRYNSRINKGMLSKWENNKDSPSLENIRILAKYFEVSTDYLLGIAEYRGGGNLKIKKISIEMNSVNINKLDEILEKIKKVDEKYNTSSEIEVTIN